MLRCIAIRESSDKYYDKGKWTVYDKEMVELKCMINVKLQLERLYQRYGKSYIKGWINQHGLFPKSKIEVN